MVQEFQSDRLLGFYLKMELTRRAAIHNWTDSATRHSDRHWVVKAEMNRLWPRLTKATDVRRRLACMGPIEVCTTQTESGQSQLGSGSPAVPYSLGPGCRSCRAADVRAVGLRPMPHRHRTDGDGRRGS